MIISDVEKTNSAVASRMQTLVHQEYFARTPKLLLILEAEKLVKRTCVYGNHTVHVKLDSGYQNEYLDSFIISLNVEVELC